MRQIRRRDSILLLMLALAASTIIMTGTLLNDNSIVGNQLNIATAASLPFTADMHVMPEALAGDATFGPPYFRVEPHWMDNFGERHCEECVMIEYSTGPANTAGGAYIADKVYDFSEAKRAVIFVMGENGGEKVRFSFAGKDLPSGTKIPADKVNLISEKIRFAKTIDITLEQDWQRIEIPLEGTNLDKIKYPFAFQIDSDASKVRFYIGGVFFDTEPIKTPLRFEEQDVK